MARLAAESVTRRAEFVYRRRTDRLSVPKLVLRHPYLVSGVAFLLVLAGWLTYRLHGIIVDDAYITLIYARNLANGAGLVFTDGVRVEGYTDFLWVLLGAGAFKLGLDPVAVLRAVGIASGVGLIAAIWLWSECFSAAPPRLRFAPLLVTLSAPFVVWAVAGLETMAFTLLCFAATLAAVSGGRFAAASGILFFLAILARPDAVVFLVPVAAYLAWDWRQRGDPWRLATFALAVGLPLLIYWVARWAYFGDFLPNTFYAKSATSLYSLQQGALYIGFAFLLTLAIPGVLVVPLLLVRALRQGLARSPHVALLGCQLLGWLAYIWLVGGDHFTFARFAVPVLPALALLTQEAVWSAFKQTESKRVGTVAIGLMAVTMVVWMSSVFFVALPSGENQRNLNTLGQWFKDNTAPGEVIAVSAAGAIPYYSERPAIDMLGLNDRHIARNGHVDHSAPPAHKKYDAQYVLDRRPEFIVLNNIKDLGTPIVELGARYSIVSNVALLESEAFWREYRRIVIPGLGVHDVVFARSDRAEDMIVRGVVVLSPIEEGPPTD